MMKKNQVLGLVSTIVSVLLILTAYVHADDAVPVPLSDLNETENEIMNMSQYSAATHDAQAGNVTKLVLHGFSQTKHWQGYYGDITGTITLDDAQNWTMYDWYNPEPKGEIYAVANTSGISPSWSTVECFNYTEENSGQTLIDRWEVYYNMSTADVDGINETFNVTTHKLFSVGAYTITENTCPSTWTHVNDQYQQDEFSEILLQTDDYQLIFATIIENDLKSNDTTITGFDNVEHDFQMLVAEDGTSLNAGDINKDSTTYYFYVDLE